MIRINRHSGIYTLETKQLLPIDTGTAWDFFSTPKNLAAITPHHLGFHITSSLANKMYEGQIITYKVSPFPNLTVNWVTEITHVEEGIFFVDEQRFGPYQMWHHEHWFEPNSEGVMMTDKVSYKIPFGWLGHLAHILFVKKQLLHIFSYRSKKLEERFGMISD